MYPQDRLTCEFLVETKEKYGWPHQVMATTGKNSEYGNYKYFGKHVCN